MDRNAAVTEIMMRLDAAWEREFEGKLVAAFKQALQEFDSERGRSASSTPPRFQETKLGRIGTAILYGAVGLMSLGVLAYSCAIARKFELLSALFK